MHRPERLRQAVQLDLLEGRVAGMIDREAAVIGRMPVLRGHHEVEVGQQPVHHRHDGVAIRHGERTAGEEVVLDVHEDERLHG